MHGKQEDMACIWIKRVYHGVVLYLVLSLVSAACCGGHDTPVGSSEPPIAGAMLTMRGRVNEGCEKRMC